MCPTAWNTKAVSAVVLHMLLSGFFNTCSFCFCHPALHGNINLWLADSQSQVSPYSREHIRTLDFPERIHLFFFFQASRSLSWFFSLSSCPSLNIVLIVSANKTVASADVLIGGQDVQLCSESHHSHCSPLRRAKPIVDVCIFNQFYQRTA